MLKKACWIVQRIYQQLCPYSDAGRFLFCAASSAPGPFSPMRATSKRDQPQCTRTSTPGQVEHSECKTAAGATLPPVQGLACGVGKIFGGPKTAILSPGSKANTKGQQHKPYFFHLQKACEIKKLPLHVRQRSRSRGTSEGFCAFPGSHNTGSKVFAQLRLSKDP